LTGIKNWKSIFEYPNNIAGIYTHELSVDYFEPKYKVYSVESYNTPLSPNKRWTDGTFDFPNEWYWKRGVLTNDKDKDRDFLYLHFMHWRSNPWSIRCGNAQWGKLKKVVHHSYKEAKNGFKINEKGFFKL